MVAYIFVKRHMKPHGRRLCTTNLELLTQRHWPYILPRLIHVTHFNLKLSVLWRNNRYICSSKGKKTCLWSRI